MNAIELDKACCAFLGSEHGIEADAEFLVDRGGFAEHLHGVEAGQPGVLDEIYVAHSP